MRRVIIFGSIGVVAVVLFLFLRACAGPTARAFLYSDQNTLAFLSWTESDGKLTGGYVENGQSASLTGQYQENRYAFRIGVASSLRGTLTGNTLETPFTDEHAMVVMHRWYPGTPQEYTALLAAFNAYTSVKTDLINLQTLQGLASLPQDSNPDYFRQALTNAQKRVDDEQHGLALVQHAGASTCTEVADFNLSFPLFYQDSTLQLPFSQTLPFSSPTQVAQRIVDRSGIAQSVHALQADDQKAKKFPVPTIAGLSLAWRIVPEPALQQGMGQVAALQREVGMDIPQFIPLQQRAAVIQQQVQVLAQSHQCY